MRLLTIVVLGSLLAGSTVALAALSPLGGEFELYGNLGVPEFDESAPELVVNTRDDHALYLWSSSFTSDTARIVAAATTLDPTIALVQSIFVVAGAGNTPREVDGAFDPVSNVFLAVWAQADSVSAPDAFEIWGRTISADFATLSAPFQISTMGTGPNDARFDARKPAVAAHTDAGGFVVVWAGDDDGSGLADGETSIFARRVEADGTLRGSGRAAISAIAANGGQADAPAIAYDDLAREFVVVYEGDLDGGLYEPAIYSNRLRPDATAVDGGAHADSPVSFGPSPRLAQPARNPDLAYDSRNNRFLVVWDEVLRFEGDEMAVNSRLLEIGAPALAIQRVSEDGSGGNLIRAARDPKVAYSLFSDGFVVTWSGTPSAFGPAAFEVLAREVDRDGTPQGTLPFVVSETASWGTSGVEAVTPAIVASPVQNVILTAWSGAETIPFRFAFWSRSFTLTVATAAPPAPVPLALSLSAAPNPFNPATVLQFTVPETARTRITIHDVRGQLVRTLVQETFTAGAHQRSWDGRDDRGAIVGSGVYHARIWHPSGTQQRKLVLLK